MILCMRNLHKYIVNEVRQVNIPEVKKITQCMIWTSISPLPSILPFDPASPPKVPAALFTLPVRSHEQFIPGTPGRPGGPVGTNMQH